MSTRASGVLGFHLQRLLLGSRRNTDEISKEWNAMDLWGIMQVWVRLPPLLITSQFSGLQFSTGHKCSESGSGCLGL